MNDFLEVTCPNCLGKKRIRREWLGRKVECPCGHEFILTHSTEDEEDFDKSLATEASPDNNSDYDDFVNDNVEIPEPKQPRPNKKTNMLERSLTEWMLMVFGVISILIGLGIFFSGSELAVVLGYGSIVCGVMWFAILQICEHLREILNELRRK